MKNSIKSTQKGQTKKKTKAGLARTTTKKESKHISFVELVLKGKAQLSEVDNFIDLWHDTDTSLLLHEFLGLTYAECKQFFTKADTLAEIIEKKRKKTKK